MLTLDKSQGEFNGPRLFDNREIKVRIHNIKQFDIKPIEVNGQNIEFNIKNGKKSSMPLGVETIDDCVEFKFTQNVNEEYYIVMYLSK